MHLTETWGQILNLVDHRVLNHRLGYSKEDNLQCRTLLTNLLYFAAFRVEYDAVDLMQQQQHQILRVRQKERNKHMIAPLLSEI